MFSERGPRNTGEQSESLEQLNLERQKKKLTGFYLSGGDEGYIFGSDDERFSESKITPGDQANVYQAMRDGADFADIEWKLLTRIAGPDYAKGADGVFRDMAGDGQQKRILGYMTGMAWDDFDKTSRDSVVEFLRKYPTPMDFDESATNFLQMISDYNSEKKHQEYVEAMEKFQSGVYGKKYEYYKAMKEMHKEAEEENPRTERGRAENGRFGQKLFEIFNRDRLITDSGLATVSRGALRGSPNEPNEDAAYYNPAIGLFGVFDGAGGMGGAARASELGTEVVGYSANQAIPETPGDLARILTTASEAVRHDPGAGYSTAVLGRIVETRGRKALVYAAVGDSRIYIVRGEEAILLTRDEGFGNRITNALGIEDFRVKQTGEFPLEKGDRIVFCSDGVTGDYEPDFIPEDDFVSVVRGGDTADMAAQALINRATKKDDRTAIVVEV